MMLIFCRSTYTIKHRIHREQFTVEDPNQFVSILDGGSTNERQFYEAIFMGSSEPVDCKSERSSHILDGKW